MANRIESIKSYSIKSSDVFFFDNNVWMYLLCPIGNYKASKQAEYSKFFSYVVSRKVPIFTNSLVISEFANRYLKLDFALENSKKGNPGRFKDFKKDYLKSAEGKATINFLKNQIGQILKVCEKCSDEFNSINTDDVMQLFVEIGFNDSYYVNQAKKKNWIIVSDDSDFTRNQIPDKNLLILTL